MKKLLLLLLSILISYSTPSQAEAMKCYTKNEVGEMSYGEDFIFERTNKLDKSKPSILDFDELKIINADTGKFFSMTKESNNHFKSGKYHYLTNDRRSVVVEIIFNEVSKDDFVFSKILMCEPF
jgi:hypothetical protein